MPDNNNLEDLLLQAAGRTTGAGKGGGARGPSSGQGQRWSSQQQQRGRRGSSYSGGSGSDDDGGGGGDGGDSDDSDAAPTLSRKRPPSGSQVPLKKRHQPEKGGGRGGGGGGWKEGDDDDDDDDDDELDEGRRSGDDSDSAPSVGSDLYKDEDDKEQLEKMSELDREMILAERGARIDDYKLKQLARASSSSSKADKSRRDSSPPPPPSRARSSARTDRSAAKSALDELRAKRMRQQDPEGYRNRFKDLIPQSGSPPRRRAGSPPSDGSNDGDNRGRITDETRDDEFDESPSRLDPLKFDDVKSITLRRSKLVKWFMEPFFEDLVSGCFVRLGIGKSKSGTPDYRLCIVRNVDANDPDRKYKLEGYTTCKYLNVVWDNEANAARWQMTQVSDSFPSEEEFKKWLQVAEKNGVRVPTRQEVLEKKEAIQQAYNFVYSARTVQKMLKEKKSAIRRPINVAAEKDRLRNELDMAIARRDEAEAERIRSKLNQLQKMSKPISNNEKAAKLEAMNKKNRAENFKNASEMKPVNTSLKVGEAGYDPFSRRWTRSRNYYAAKPEGESAEVPNGNDGSAVAGDEDTKNGPRGGSAATAAALVAAADAGKLVDTNAPVDLGTESNLLHNFELGISLAGLEEFGGPKGLFDGYMARKQKIEATMGYKVPDNDGRRHALTLTVSDYKRRRGLL
uniref:Plus3 domain-containing protein n=1 Tax=Oryza nivara TaxID=4536 RepID=A0A0E0FNX5_ORYNI